MLGDFEHQPVALVVGFERIQDRRQMILELHVDDGADNLGDFSDTSHRMLLQPYQTTVNVTGTLLRVARE